VKDLTIRLTIPQILAHPWFTSRKLNYEPNQTIFCLSPVNSERPSTPENQSRRNSESTAPGSSETSTQESPSPFTSQPELESSTPTTPEGSVVDPFESTGNNSSDKPSIQRHSSNSTIRKTSGSDLESLTSKLAKTGDRQPDTVMEECENTQYHFPPALTRPSVSEGPAAFPVRTPARTKRRSVSSVMSETGSPTRDKSPTPLPTPVGRDVDFVSLLTANTPVMFSTPDERRLLNNLSSVGLDTAQIVHSVLSYACDSAGALWWMLRKKEEKTVGDEVQLTGLGAPVVDSAPVKNEPMPGDELRESQSKKKKKVNAGVQTDPQQQKEKFVAPQFAVVPPTPTTTIRPTTPQKNGNSTRSPFLSPTSDSFRSHPSSPSGGHKDKDKEQGPKGRKARAGSVSIMQRATTALEAAGLVRKKSTEAVREERERLRDGDRRVASNEEPRLSHGSASSKLTKSPPLRPTKDYLPPSTPPPNDHKHNVTHMGSPWVLADGREAVSTSAIATVSAKGEMLHSHSTPNISDNTPKALAPPRHKSNLLATFRLWFNEERKGKRKDDTANVAPVGGPMRVPARRNSSSGKFTAGRGVHRARPSISSRRSSSINSRRSSVQSAHMVMVESPLQTRRPLGSHTPNSELAGEHSSRPSSVRSFSMQQRHRKSPSQSSAGSLHFRTSSPMKFHRRGGSGSSTRVVRQVAPMSRPLHARSNSATSSTHSPTSSRPTSFYEPSETECTGNLNISRTSSPFKGRRKSTDDSSSSSRRAGTGASTFVAQKRQGPFASPAQSGSIFGRSSWKRSWGVEPPGWSSRAVHLPIEVIDILPTSEPVSIRDVFSGKQSAGDDSDWIDEDDDIPAFAGGLGQMGTSVSVSSSNSSHLDLQTEPQPIIISAAPRGQRSRRNNNRSTGGRSKAGHSPVPKSSPLPSETLYESNDTRVGRRQLPTGRSGPAFKHAIQEEDEGEEE
jgi:hypothetical protein